MAFTEDDLRKMGMVRNEDGSYSKAKSKPQPRELEKAKVISNGNVNVSNVKRDLFLEYSHFNDDYKAITLTLFGDPMPKQSVRSFVKNGKIMHYQPKEMSDRTKDYIRQIKEQLPKDFVPFSEIVFVTKMHFIFPPLKAFHKVKGKMDAIRNGEIFYKTTKPDLPDNLKKLVNDSMSGLVFVDDCLIAGEDNIRKYYGVGGCIIIELKGK